MRTLLFLTLVGISAMISQVAGRRQRPNRPKEVTLTIAGEVFTYECRTQCPPQTLASGKVCSDTGKTFQNVCKMLKKKCRGDQIEFASSGRCVNRQDCKKNCGREGPEVCDAKKRYANRCRFDRANCFRGQEGALEEIPCPTTTNTSRPAAPAPLIKEPARQEIPFLPVPTNPPVSDSPDVPEAEVPEEEEDGSPEEEESEGGSEAQPQGGDYEPPEVDPSPDPSPGPSQAEAAESDYEAPESDYEAPEEEEEEDEEDD